MVGHSKRNVANRTENKQMSQKRQTVQITGAYLLRNDFRGLGLIAVLKQEYRSGFPPF